MLCFILFPIAGTASKIQDSEAEYGSSQDSSFLITQVRIGETTSP